LAKSKEFLSKGKGESYDEICIFGTDDMVLVLFNHRYVFYGIGRMRTLATGLDLPSFATLDMGGFAMLLLLSG
jgi:hypothetical protein